MISFTNKSMFFGNLLPIFTIILLFIIISGEILFVIQNSVFIEILIIIIVVRSAFIIILMVFIIYKINNTNKTILTVSIVLGIAILLIIISEDIKTIFGYSQNDLLPILPSKIILLPIWVLDVINITVLRLISNLISLDINFIILIIGYTFFCYLLLFLVKEVNINNENFIESSLEGIFLIIIILEVFLRFLEQNSHIFMSSIISSLILALFLIINKKKLMKFEEMDINFRLIIYWLFLIFLNHENISINSIDSLIFRFGIIIPYIENLIIITAFIIYISLHTIIIQKLDSETQLQLNSLIYISIIGSFYFNIIFKQFFLADWMLIWIAFIIVFFISSTIFYFRVSEKKDLTNEEVTILIFLSFLLLITGF